MNVFEQKHEEDVSGFTEVALWIHMLIEPSISRHALCQPWDASQSAMVTILYGPLLKRGVDEGCLKPR